MTTNSWQKKWKPGLCTLLSVLCFLSFYDTAATAAEPAWWTQKKSECGLPGSTAYNTWVSQGSPCPGKSGGSRSSISQDGTTNIVEGVMRGNAQQTGLGIIQNLLKPQSGSGSAQDSGEQQRRAEEQQRQAEEQRRQAAERQRLADEEAQLRQELAKQRILGELKDTDPSGGLRLKMDSDSELQVKTGDESASASLPLTPKGAVGKPIPRSDAYNRGFNDASTCFSQNGGTYCAGAGAEQQACIADYRGGYAAGDKQRKKAMDEAYGAGKRAGANGELANGASDARAEGTCRTEWIQSYNRGHFKGKQSKAH